MKFFLTTLYSGSSDDLWYDSASNFEYDCGDEDFQSAPDDGSKGVSWPTIGSLREGDVHRSSVHPEQMVLQSNMDENAGIISNNMLLEKKILTSSPSNTRKKAAYKLSFKRNDEHTTATMSFCWAVGFAFVAVKWSLQLLEFASSTGPLDAVMAACSLVDAVGVCPRTVAVMIFCP